MKHNKRKISVTGLGYVGLPVAIAFAEADFLVIGFDVNISRINDLNKAIDVTFEVENERLTNPNITFTSNPSTIHDADFHIITVPTPVTDKCEPDISFLIAASQTVGKQLSVGDVVVYESTVYPGCTEEDCIPVLESVSSLIAGTDFFVGYSPERINPGDLSHRFETILKIVSAQCPQSLEIIANTYASVVTAGVYQAPSIKVAEAAKVIENTQRDLNIGFVNELSKIFKIMDIDTHDVLRAASTKWNFNVFEPGLVGGHCIGVDPYYLTSKAKKIGADPRIILSGRETNDDYPGFIIDQCQQWLDKQGLVNPRVLLMGITFKEDVPDIRNSRAFELAQKFKSIDPSLEVIDPVAELGNYEPSFRFNKKADDAIFDVIVLAVPHAHFIADPWLLIHALTSSNCPTLVMDIKAKLDRDATPQHIELWRP
ncbi:nucleotide sugar dehydrogenase [Alphaproteobacteria bacterium]|nr:nucleotide sugar dehydrogenase [Alphaproteobacteria bacterium]